MFVQCGKVPMPGTEREKNLYEPAEGTEEAEVDDDALLEVDEDVLACLLLDEDEETWL